VNDTRKSLDRMINRLDDRIDGFRQGGLMNSSSMSSGQHTRFYRDKLNGKIMGVCAGIADYTGVDPLWVRLGAMMLFFTLGPIMFMAYFLTGFLAPKKPANLYGNRDEQKFWQGVRQSPGRTAREVRARFRDIDRRLADVESFYVSNNPRLSAEIERLR
jgi:phage shock protein C